MGQEGVAVLIMIAGCLVLVALLIYVGLWMVHASEAMDPSTVARRAVDLRRQQTEQRIAEVGEATRVAIQEAARRHR
jgi:uncharacterized membrane protein